MSACDAMRGAPYSCGRTKSRRTGCAACSNASESLEDKRWRCLSSAAVAEFLNSDFTEKTEIFEGVSYVSF